MQFGNKLWNCHHSKLYTDTSDFFHEFGGYLVKIAQTNQILPESKKG